MENDENRLDGCDAEGLVAKQRSQQAERSTTHRVEVEASGPTRSVKQATALRAD